MSGVPSIEIVRYRPSGVQRSFSNYNCVESLRSRLQRQCTSGAPAPHAGDFCFGKSHQNHLPLALRRLRRCPRGGAGLRRFSDGTSDLHGWRKCKGLSGTILAMCRIERATCSASLSLLSRASPGFAFRGKPVQRGKGPLDLCIYPLHPSRSPSGLSFACAPRSACFKGQNFRT